jgi:hypothetical protein
LKRQAWIISVDMGYGHQRAAYPLKDIAYDRVITANSDKIITDEEKKTWKKLQRFYEGVSRFRSFPIIGQWIWNIYDYFQTIEPFYPFRDLSMPNFGCVRLHNLIRKGFLRSIVDYSRKMEIPFVTTFFAPAIAAAYRNRDNVYCIVTDTDINRIWVPRYPKKYGIVYCASTERSAKRLIEYGVPQEFVFFTGFPLPKENVGPRLEILKKDFCERLVNLDPKKVFLSQYRDIVRRVLGKKCNRKSSHPLTLTFAVGGAGAQKEIGAALLTSLKEKIRQHKIRLVLVAGTRPEIEQYFEGVVDELKLGKELGSHIIILCAIEKKTYFRMFNELLHTTDILWTKPCELCFYTALGIPIIIAPNLGKHEIVNQKWLVKMGAGIEQESPFYADEWLFEMLNDGTLAKQAWQGFTCAPKYGTYNIENLIFARARKNVKLRY